LVAEGHDENQLFGISVPTGGHSPADLALSPVHLSLRDVEDLLAERGIVISYETVRRWVNHFGPIISAELRKRRPKPHAVWHLDEVYLKIDGRMVYLGRAVDAEGEVLDVFVQSKRDKRDALKLMRKLLGRGDDLRNGDSQEGANRIQR
jgi:transposase-like protein